MNNPICKNNYSEKCIYLKRGSCMILTNAYFKGRRCPFQKSLKKHHKQKIHVYKRLNDVGFFDTPIEGVDLEVLERDYKEETGRAESFLRLHGIKL